MSAILRLVLRVLSVTIAFSIACLAGSLFVHFLVWGGLPQPDESRDAVAVFSVLTVPLLAVWIAHQAFVPAGVMILIAEVRAARDWLTYCFGGAVVALAGVLITPSGIDPSDAGSLSVSAATGLVGGWVYWLVAGSRAGRWRAAQVMTYDSPALGHQDPDSEG